MKNITLIEKLKEQSTWRLFGLGLITFGIYYAHYIKRQTHKINEYLTDEEKIPDGFTNTFLIVSYVSILLLIGYLFVDEGHPLEDISSLFDIAWAVMILVWGFTARNRVNAIFGILQGDKSWFHGLWSPLFSPMYFNYKVNQIYEYHADPTNTAEGQENSKLELPGTLSVKRIEAPALPKQVKMSSVKFLILYIVLMIPTYFWRFGLIGSAMEGGDDFDFINNTIIILLLISYAGMAVVSYKRGAEIGKKHLFAFPIVGGVFDIVLVFIPLVPTVMNIITIVIGMSDANVPSNNIENARSREEIECPTCAELVLQKASKCKHCGHELKP